MVGPGRRVSQGAVGEGGEVGVAPRAGDDEERGAGLAQREADLALAVEVDDRVLHGTEAGQRDARAPRCRCRVGSCHETTEPVVTPMPCRPAATRSARSRNWPNVTVSPSAAMSMGWSGEASARRSTSSHMVRAPVSISLGWLIALLSGPLHSSWGTGWTTSWRGKRQNGSMARKPVHRDPLTEHVAEDDKKGLDRRRQATLIGVAMAGIAAGVVRAGQPAGRQDRLLGLQPPGASDPRHRDLGPARGPDHGAGHAAQGPRRGVGGPAPGIGSGGGAGRAEDGRARTYAGRQAEAGHYKSVTAFRRPAGRP